MYELFSIFPKYGGFILEYKTAETFPIRLRFFNRRITVRGGSVEGVFPLYLFYNF